MEVHFVATAVVELLETPSLYGIYGESTTCEDASRFGLVHLLRVVRLGSAVLVMRLLRIGPAYQISLKCTYNAIR